MRSYEVNIANDKTWISTGQITRRCIVFSEDITGAMMDAAEQFELLRKALLDEGCPEDDANSIRITSIQEHSEVCGRTAMKVLGRYLNGSDSVSPEDWAKSTALKIKAERNA